MTELKKSNLTWARLLNRLYPGRVVNHPLRSYLVMIGCTLLLLSCGSMPATPAPSNMAVVHIPKTDPKSETPSAFQSIHANPTATYMPNAEIIEVAIWVPPYLADTLGGALDDPLRGLFVSDAALANIRLEVREGNLVSQWVYALVTPFSSTMQGVSGDDLLLSWQGQSNLNQPLLMDQNTYDMFSAVWGTAAPAPSVQVLAKDELIDYAWAHQPALAIVPFEALDSRWKVLAVDGLSPIHKDFDLANYRLKIPISLNSSPELAALIKSNFAIPSSNLDPQKMTILAMTGVTALVRATAYEMEQHGITYPAQDIRDWLLGAEDRKSTRLNSSHGYISYAVFCLKKKKKNKMIPHTI